uniref:hypothetical protein n=1 Tax=Paenarthrobacter ureafaciens TaxID=37931 RepID=UPI003F4926CE
MTTTQTFSGISLAEFFPGLPEFLERLTLVVCIPAVIGTIYLLVGFLIAHSRGNWEFGDDERNVLFHAGFIMAISAPVISLATAGIPGLIPGSIAGGIIALATAWAWRRRHARSSGTPG